MAKYKIGDILLFKPVKSLNTIIDVKDNIYYFNCQEIYRDRSWEWDCKSSTVDNGTKMVIINSEIVNILYGLQNNSKALEPNADKS